MAPRKPKTDTVDEVKRMVNEAAPRFEPQPEQGPKSPQEIATEMAKAGVPESVIVATLNTMFGGGDGQGAAPATPGGGETLGPDPKMVAAYHERMKNYVKPKKKFNFGALNSEDPKLRELLEKIVDGITAGDDAVLKLLEGLHGFGGVPLPKMFMEWCVQWQYWQGTIRKMPPGEDFSEQKVLEDMVRYHWFRHPQERARLQAAINPNQTSGLKSDFNPAAGTWSN